jgi:hypothetical protein
MKDDGSDLIEIIAKSANPELAAERIYQLFGRRFIVEETKLANDDQYTRDAYRGAEDDDEDEDDEAETNTLSERERQRRARRDMRRAGVPPPDAARKRDLSMLDSDVLNALVQKHDDGLIESVREKGCGMALIEYIVNKGQTGFSEFQLSRIMQDHCGADFAKRYSAPTDEGRKMREATLIARNANWLGV